jgi:hypothetical protein
MLSILIFKPRLCGFYFFIDNIVQCDEYKTSQLCYNRYEILKKVIT